MDGLEEIISVINAEYNIDIASSSRLHPIPMARGIYCTLAYRITSFVWSAITDKIDISTSMMNHYQRKYKELYGTDREYTHMYDTVAKKCMHVREHYLNEFEIDLKGKSLLEVQIELLENNARNFEYGGIDKMTFLSLTRKAISGLKEIEYDACK